MKKTTTVIVDAGHGVNTPGKRSPDGLLMEYAWNRDCAALLTGWLNGIGGFRAFLLVPETSEEDIPLATRVTRANQIYKDRKDTDNVVLVSIHCNAHGDGKKWTKAKGWSIYTTKGETISDKIATAIYNAAVTKFGKAKLRADWSDKDPDYESDFYILRKVSCPAVLIENFFMTNREDCEYLLSPISIYDCAEVVVTGLKSFYNEMAFQNR